MCVNQERLWEHMKVLCEQIGARLMGTAGGGRAAGYIAEHFRRCGAEVEVQDFPCTAWDHEATELTLLGRAGPEALCAVAQTFSEACDVEAELAAVGTVYELEFSPDLEGKVLLLYGEAGTGLALDRNPKLLSAEERRPCAAIVVSPDETVSTKLIRDPFLRVPAAAVPTSVGLRLRENEGERVRLRIRARRYGSTGHNVIGRLAGEGEGRIAIAAHYDTAACCPGAADNASGTAVILDLCEVFAAGSKHKLGMDFIAYDGEEYGRHEGNNLGAAEYVRRHAAEARQTQAVVEADFVGTAINAPSVRVAGWPSRQQEQLLRVLRRFPRHIVDVRPGTEPPRTSLNLAGVPSLWFVNEYRSSPIHTAQDVLSLVSPRELAFSAQVIAAVVDHLASGNGEGIS
jgi:hypothetical protein